MTFQRSTCPIATALDILGDKWTLVVLRDLLIGKKRFGEFLESPEKITTNILTDRLRRLEHEGFIERRAYQHKPPRYEYYPTSRGESLLPLLQELCRWGNTHYPGTYVPPDSFMKRKPKI